MSDIPDLAKYIDRDDLDVAAQEALGHNQFDNRLFKYYMNNMMGQIADWYIDNYIEEIEYAIESISAPRITRTDYVSHAWEMRLVWKKFERFFDDDPGRVDKYFALMDNVQMIIAAFADDTYSEMVYEHKLDLIRARLDWSINAYTFPNDSREFYEHQIMWSLGREALDETERMMF